MKRTELNKKYKQVESMTPLRNTVTFNLQFKSHHQINHLRRRTRRRTRRGTRRMRRRTRRRTRKNRTRSRMRNSGGKKLQNWWNSLKPKLNYGHYLERT